ncbi:MAG: hypothetical protein ACF8SC_08460 [Phycisphaerales bacterium JB037]
MDRTVSEQRTVRLGAAAASVYLLALLCRIWAWVMLAGLGFLVVMMAWFDARALRLGLVAGVERGVERAALAFTASPAVAQVFLVSALGACACTALEMSVLSRTERVAPRMSVLFAAAGAVLALAALVSSRQSAVQPLWTEIAMYVGAGSQVLLFGSFVLARIVRVDAPDESVATRI